MSLVPVFNNYSPLNTLSVNPGELFRIYNALYTNYHNLSQGFLREVEDNGKAKHAYFQSLNTAFYTVFAGAAVDCGGEVMQILDIRVEKVDADAPFEVFFYLAKPYSKKYKGHIAPTYFEKKALARKATFSEISFNGKSIYPKAAMRSIYQW